MFRKAESSHSKTLSVDAVFPNHPALCATLTPLSARGSGSGNIGRSACRETRASGFRGTVVAISQPKTTVNNVVLGVVSGRSADHLADQVGRPVRTSRATRRVDACSTRQALAVRTVAWNAVRGCGCRSRAARRATPERLPGRKLTCTSSPQSAGGPRAGETGGGGTRLQRCRADAGRSGSRACAWRSPLRETRRAGRSDGGRGGQASAVRPASRHAGSDHRRTRSAGVDSATGSASRPTRRQRIRTG